jgi:hypothetical protein
MLLAYNNISGVIKNDRHAEIYIGTSGRFVSRGRGDVGEGHFYPTGGIDELEYYQPLL